MVSRQLQFYLLQMIGVNMCIPKGVDEIPGLKSAALRDHMGEQCIGSDVEWNAQEEVGTPLIKLTTQSVVGHIELKQQMTWRQCHVFHLSYIP